MFFLRSFTTRQGTRVNISLIEFLVMMIALCQALPTVFSISLYQMNIDPIYSLLGPSTSSLIYVKLLRFLLTEISSNFVGAYMNIVFMASLIQVSELAHCSGVILGWAWEQTQSMLRLQRESNIKPGSNVNVYVQMRRVHELNMVLKVYRKIQIISVIMQDTYMYFYAATIGSGAIVLVMCNYACVRMYGTLNFSLVILFLCVSFFIFVFMLTVFPVFDSFYETSLVFLRHMRSLSGKQKILKRQVESYRPCRIVMCPLFFAKKSTKCSYVDNCFQFTANALLV